MFIIRPYCQSDKDELINLWCKCGLTHPDNDPARDIARKMEVNPEWLLVGLNDGKLVASVMVGYDGHRGWVNYLGVDPDCRKQGLGREMMAKAELVLKAAGCPKINLQVRSSNSSVLAFYKAIGFRQDDVIGMSRRFVIDNPEVEGYCPEA